MSELNEWDSFYVIVASAAGALIGLQFIVLTLIAERPPPHGSDANAAFATPTIVHFSAVLLLGAMLRAPWHTITSVAAFWGLIALAGIVYGLIVIRRMRSQDAYKPGFEDWFFHAVLPLAAYGVLALAAPLARSYLHEALFAVGGASLLLLFIGIHNTWDAVVYHVFVTRAAAKKSEK